MTNDNVRPHPITLYQYRRRFVFTRYTHSARDSNYMDVFVESQIFYIFLIIECSYIRIASESINYARSFSAKLPIVQSPNQPLLSDCKTTITKKLPWDRRKSIPYLIPCSQKSNSAFQTANIPISSLARFQFIYNRTDDTIMRLFRPRKKNETALSFLQHI